MMSQTCLILPLATFVEVMVVCFLALLDAPGVGLLSGWAWLAIGATNPKAAMPAATEALTNRVRRECDVCMAPVYLQESEDERVAGEQRGKCW